MIEPRSNEWYALRLGRFSASEAHKLMGERVGINTATAQTYIFEKVAEQLTGCRSAEFETAATRWGLELEPDARDYYELAFRCTVDQIEPIIIIPYAVGSPDGIVKVKNKGVEFKCPYNSANHVQYMTVKNGDDLKAISKAYYWQVQFYMMLTNFKMWDFVSYDPRFTGKYRMYAVEIKRNETDIDRLKTALYEANEMKCKILNLIER